MITRASEHTSIPPPQQQGSDGPVRDEFDLVVSRVADLQHQDEEADAGIGKPTEYTMATALSLLTQVRPLVGGSFPRATASTTTEGGIHIYWKSQARIVQVSVPSQESEMGFIYHQNGQEYAVDMDLSARMLANWLHWFSNA